MVFGAFVGERGAMAGSIDTWGVWHVEDLEDSSIRLMARLVADVRFPPGESRTFSEEGVSTTVRLHFLDRLSKRCIVGERRH